MDCQRRLCGAAARASRQALRVIAAVLWLVLLASPAAAHSFYDKSCCADHDCHPVPCERITMVAGGFEYRAYDNATYFFTRDKLRVSPDGDCHACVHNESHSATCVYLPVRM